MVESPDLETDNDIYRQLFGDMKVVSVYFSEPPNSPMLRAIMHRSASAGIGELAPQERREIVGGLYPLLLQEYETVFDQDLEGHDLARFLMQEEERRFIYTTFYASHVLAVEIWKEAARKLGWENVSLIAHEGGAHCLVPCQRGNRLTTAHFAIEALPQYADLN